LVFRAVIWLCVSLCVTAIASADSQFQFNGANVNIPDGPNGPWVSSQITISGAPAGAVVTGVDVYFQCIHPYSGDLIIDLNADAQGALGNYNLWNQQGGAADNPSGTVAGISTYNGLSVNRTWYLYARDMAALDVGYINEWSITVYYSAPSDLITQGLATNPTNGPAGSSAAVSFTIKNQGGSVAGSSMTNIRISNSSANVTTSDPLLASISTPSIGAGGTFPINQSVTIPLSLGTGTKYIWVILDVNSSAGQGSTNELNDKSNVPFVITVPPAPDLVTQNLVVNPSSGFAGSPATVSFTIKNQGNGSAGSSTTNIRISNSSSNVTTSDPLLASIATPGIGAGGTSVVSQPVTIPSSLGTGPKYIWVILDVNSTAGQGAANELNDKSNVPFLIIEPPSLSDLITQNLAVVPSNGVPESLVDVSFTIKNQGGNIAGSSTTNIRISNSSSNVTTSDPLLASIATPSIGAGGTLPINQPVIIPSSLGTGTKYIWVILDVNSNAGQGAANELNDKSNVQFVVSQPLPTAEWVLPPPPSLVAGELFTVEFTTTGSPAHVNVHWDPTDPATPGCCLIDDSVSDSTFSPTPSPAVLTAPTLDLNGVPLTAPTTVIYAVHVSNGEGEAYSEYIPVTIQPSGQGQGDIFVTPNELDADCTGNQLLMMAASKDAGVDRANPLRQPAPCVITYPEGGVAGPYETSTWPFGIVPFEFDPAVTQADRDAMLDAMFELQSVAGVYFVPRTTQMNYISIHDHPFANNSNVGMVGGQQIVNIHDWDFHYVICHELIHALGFWHTQSRTDRDQYVQINSDNICQTCCSGGACSFNFAIVPVPTFGEYDFDSVMHYGQYAFSNNGLPTITVLPPHEAWQDDIGHLDHLSDGDIAGLQFLYPQSSGGSDSFTIVNAGTGNLTISSISLDVPAAWINWNAPATPFVISPGATQVVSLQIDCASAPFGESSRRLLIHSDDPDPSDNPYPNGVFVTITNDSPAVAPLIADIPDAVVRAPDSYLGPTPVLLQGTLPVSWTLIAAPFGMTIDPATGVVSWSVSDSSNSPYLLTIRATNEAGVDDESWWLDVNGPCLGDIVASTTFQPPGDGTVDGADLAFLLGEWGQNPDSIADFVTNSTFAPPPDGVVDGADLAVLLGAWGACQ